MHKKQLLLILAGVLVTFAAAGQNSHSVLSYVKPMIGTGYNGHTFPGAVRPFGMIQASPDTGDRDWEHCAGYRYDDNTILGFSQTHLSGTGAGDLGDIRFIPVTGEPRFTPGTPEAPETGYRSRYSHDTEIATPGYYAVTLDDYDVRIEVTATERCALYRISFPKDRQAGIIFDMDGGISDETLDAGVSQAGLHGVKGWRHSDGFVENHTFYFWADFSEDPVNYEFSNDRKQAYVRFPEGKTMLMRLGLSTVSEEGARANLRKEIPGWDFNAVKTASEKEWEKALSCITVEKALSEDDKVKLYTSLYHTMIAPSLINDLDGDFFGWDGKDHHSDSPVYTTFSLWDTYRALHPLYNLVMPEANRSFIRSMLEFNREKGFLPIHVFGISEALRMIGIHSLPVIADAITQDLGGFDVEEAYDAMHALALNDSVPYVRATQLSRNKNPYTRGIGDLLKIGYIPSENERESVSKTMEYAYDHWCLAEAARKLGKSDDAAFFDKMGLNYRNVIDTTTGFARGRHADGSWVTPFSPDWVTSDEHHDFTEGNAWQYTFYVPQDVTNYIGILGGDEVFAKKLDEMFTRRLSDSDNNLRDVSGLIGQYAHGNEPSHQIAYLYNFVGQPWKTQKLVNQIKTELYSTANDGLCGNEDCGQMSAWYIFSAMGFYPVTPAIGYYVIGAPTFPEATLRLEGGKTFKIKADNLSDKNIYVQGVTLNGKPYKKSWISVGDVKKGGTIVFDMGSSPSEWGASAENRPVAKIVQ